MSHLRKPRLVLLSAVLALLQPTCAAADKEIRFARGATSARVSGVLVPDRDVCYTLRARAGQHMSATVKAKGPTRGEVTAPSGSKEGQPGDVFYDEALPETGSYRICVRESQMGESWKGSFELVIEIR